MKADPELIKVLLVDDDPEDVELTMEVLEMAKMKLNVQVKSDGVETMEYLDRCLNDQPDNLPDLVLLDLNMPRMNGHEVLQEMKQHEKLKRIPVVVLTTSSSETDIQQSYSNGVSCFVTKPVGLEAFQKVVEAVNTFWFTVVKFPEKK